MDICWSHLSFCCITSITPHHAIINIFDLVHCSLEMLILLLANNGIAFSFYSGFKLRMLLDLFVIGFILNPS